MSSPSDPGRNLFHWRKSKKYSVLQDDFVCSKALQCGLSSCHSWVFIKIGPFSSCIRNTTCLYVLPAWLETQTLPCPWLCTWFSYWDCCQSWPGSQRLIRGFSYQNAQSEASAQPYLRNLHSTHPTHFETSARSSDWYLNTLKSSYWNFRVNPKKYSRPFPNFRRNELRHGAAFLTDSAHLTLIRCTVDKTWNQQITSTKLII